MSELRRDWLAVQAGQSAPQEIHEASNLKCKTRRVQPAGFCLSIYGKLKEYWAALSRADIRPSPRPCRGSTLSRCCAPSSCRHYPPVPTAAQPVRPAQSPRAHRRRPHHHRRDSFFRRVTTIRRPGGRRAGKTNGRGSRRPWRSFIAPVCRLCTRLRIRECEEHGWMQDRADPHARERAFDIARRDPPPGVSPQAAAVAIAEVLEPVGDTCPECPPED
jgi:hypothetical protein